MQHVRTTFGRTAAVAALAMVGLLLTATGAWAGWNLPAQAISAGPVASNSHVIAVSPDGTTTVAWTRPDSDNGNITRVETATRLPGSLNFSAPEFISDTATTAGSESLDIAAGPDGSATLVWHDDGGARSMIATRPAGSTTFDPMERLGPDVPTFWPRVDTGPDGTTAVVWNRGYEVIESAVRPAGSATFEATVSASEDGAPNPSVQEPDVAVRPDGATVVTWAQYGQTGEWFARTARRSAGAADFSAPVALTADDHSVNDLHVVATADAGTTAVWRRFNGTKYAVESRTRPPGQSAFGALDEISDATAEDTSSPVVATGADGTVAVAWARITSATTATVRVRPAGATTWDAAEELGPTFIARPAVAVAPDGAVTAAWDTPVGALGRVSASTRAAGSITFDGPTTITDDPLGAPLAHFSGASALAAGADGGIRAAFTITWAGQFTGVAETSPGPDYQVQVAKAGAGKGSVTSAPGGIDCGADCAANFALSTKVKLTATPATGSAFAGWSGACTGAGATCTVTVLGARSVTARFEPLPPAPPATPATTTPAGTGTPAANTPAPSAACGTPAAFVRRALTLRKGERLRKVVLVRPGTRAATLKIVKGKVRFTPPASAFTLKVTTRKGTRSRTVSRTYRPCA